MKPPFYTRYAIITIICVVFGAAIIVQLVRINYTSYAQDLITKSEDYRGVEKTIFPARGTIYDRSGNVLATNQIGYELGIDLKLVIDPESIAFASASILEDLDYVDVFNIANL